MTVLSSGEGGGSPAVPPPPPPPISSAASPSGTMAPRLTNGTNGGTPDPNLLMADIRNGVTLKPTKTKDKSTPAFIKKSGGANTGPSSPLPAQLNGNDEDPSMAGVKDALQEELRNTLKRKVKKQDVERGDCTKKDEIEKSMEINRTEVQLKVNTSVKSSPIVANKDTLDAAIVKSNGVNSVPGKVAQISSASNGESVATKDQIKASPALAKKVVPIVSPSKLNGVEPTFVKTQLNGDVGKPPVVVNGNKSTIKQITSQNSVSNAAPPKPARLMQSNLVDNSKPVSSTNVSVKQHNPVKVEIKPFEGSRVPLNGTLRKVSPQKVLTIDINVSQDDRLKNTILSPDVVSGNAAIRPSQIKSLTQKGGHVSHTDIVENPKPIGKSPISLVESPPYTYTPPTPRSISPASSGQASPRISTRTTILDTKISKTLLSPKADPNAPQKKLMISHPKASFTLKRNSQHKVDSVHPTEPKPVFRILSNLEQSERVEAERKYSTLPRQHTKRDPPKPDDPGMEPVLISHVSFAKELSNAPNNYPDVVTKTTTVGIVKQDLFLDNTNLRDIKIDIVGGGQLKVVKK